MTSEPVWEVHFDYSQPYPVVMAHFESQLKSLKYRKFHSDDEGFRALYVSPDEKITIHIEDLFTTNDRYLIRLVKHYTPINTYGAAEELK